MPLTAAQRQQRYRDRHPERVKKSLKAYRQTAKGKAAHAEQERRRRAKPELKDSLRTYYRKRGRAERAQLAARYVKSRLGLAGATPEIVDLGRTHITLKRTLRNANRKSS